MVELLPPIELVTRWSQETQSRYCHDFFKSAYEAYQAYPAQKQDKELVRFMPSAVNWADYTMAPLQPAYRRDLGQGAYLADLKSILLDQEPMPARFIQLLERLRTSASAVELMVAATCTRAQLLYVPKNVQLKEVVELTHSTQKGTYNAELIICIIEDGAQVTLVDTQNITQALQVRSCIGILGAHARMIFLNDHQYDDESYGVSYESWSLSKQSYMSSISGLTGGKQTWATKDFILEGDNACIEHLSLAALKGKEQHALITRQQHRARATKSSMHVKALLLDAAQSFYRGIITMNEDAGQSDADQQQRALILSQSARTCAIPSLEIATHDVRCRHGSAAGRFNKEELWYLLSRGLDSASAHALLIDGFFNEHPLISEHKLLLVSMMNRLR